MTSIGETAFIVGMVAVISIGWGSSSLAADKDWVGGDGDWDVGANWGGSKPGASDDAYVDTGATVTVNTTGEQANSLSFGYKDDAAGSLTIAPVGNLTVGYLWLAVSTNSSSHLSIEAGGSLSAGGAQIGSYGSATAQIAGNFSVSERLIVGLKGSGNLTQTNGTVSVGEDLSLGSIEETSSGRYELLGGTLQVAGGYTAFIGEEGTGTLILGNATAAGSLTQTGSGNANLQVGRYVDYGGGSFTLGVGEVRGYGTVGMNGSLGLDRGSVTADGYGTERTLDLSGFNAVTNGYENAVGEQNGWYAADRGKLVLPSLAIAVGSNSYNWGESAADTEIDLVNSVRVALDNVDAAGNLSLALLATDRSEIPAGLGSIGNVVGVWEATPSSELSFETVKLTFRYDDALVTDPNDLRVYRFAGGAWSDVTGTVDSSVRTISTDSLDGFSYFAVVAIPEPGVAGLLVMGGLALLRRRGTS